MGEYAIPLIVIGSFSLLAVTEYFICKKATKASYRKLLFFIPFVIFILAIFAYNTPTSGFIDMSGLVSFLIAVYGFICSAGIGLGWLVYWYKQRKNAKESCPFSDEQSEIK